MLLDGLDDINKNGINSPPGKDPLGFADKYPYSEEGSFFGRTYRDS